MERAATCGSCVFYQPEGDQAGAELGECRIYPPAAPSPDQSPAAWPITRRSDWCAEHGSYETTADDDVTH